MLIEPWHIRLLGGLAAAQGERTITRFRTHKTAELLAYLAFYAGRAHPRERLIEVIWANTSFGNERMSLSVALSSLRSQLEPPALAAGTRPVGTVLAADRSTVHLRSDAFTTDVAAFEAALDAAAKAQEDHQEAITRLTTADGLYRGELLPGFDSEWVFTERLRLAEAHSNALRRLASLLLQQREFDRALDCAHRAVNADPLDETTRLLLMRVFAAIGRPAAALEQFQEFERVRQAAGEDPPSENTRELAQRLSEGADKGADIEATASVAKPPPSDSAPVKPSPIAHDGTHPFLHVPIPLDRFFGRTAELDAITAILRGGARLVTLTGFGGAGKTRLAVEVATRLLRGDEQTDIRFVPLADVTEPARIFDAIRDALRLSPSPSQTAQEQVLHHLQSQRERPPLLVLDNLEHLRGHGVLDPAGAAAIVRTLLHRVPTLTLLATSREPLALDEEQVVPVPPLSLPPDVQEPPAALLTFDSIALFVDRARSRRVDFQVTPRNGESVARLCKRLEGIPLAIELAAARAKLFTPAQMLERLETSFADLETHRPDVPIRHRSLQAAAAWSYALLSPEAQRLFAGLSVFRGGCTVAAAVAVCGQDSSEGEILETLERLRDAALIVTEEVRSGTAGDEMRLRLLEPLREFAAEQLTPDEQERLERRHIDYYLALAEKGSAAYNAGGQQEAWLDQAEADQENFRAALVRPGDTRIRLHLAARLTSFWMIRGRTREGGDHLQRLLEADDAAGAAPTRERGLALHSAGNLAFARTDLALAATLYQEALVIHRQVGHRRGEASLLGNLGNVTYRQGDYAEAKSFYEASLAIVREENQPAGIASALGNLANVAHDEGNLPLARSLHEECLETARAAGDTRLTADTLHNLGNVVAAQGDLEHAHALFEESLTLKQRLGYRRGIAALLRSLGHLSLQEGKLTEADRHFSEALPLAVETASKMDILECLEGFAWLATLLDQWERAAQLWGASDTHEKLTEMFPSAAELENRHTLIARVRQTAPTAAQFAAAWRKGAELSLEDASRLALEG